MNLQDIAGGIAPLSHTAMDEAQARLDALAKPPGSLGDLEAYAIRLAGITGRLPPDISRRAVVVFSADNGVCVEDIGSAPQSVTRAQTVNMARGLTGMATLARAFRASVVVADVGMLAPCRHAGVRDMRVRAGTGNIRREDAMTRGEAEAALCAGVRLAQEMAVRGYGLIGVGEMGIGNTTTSAAVLAALSGADVNRVTGIGGGIGQARLIKKRQVIRDALLRARADPSDIVGVLASLGGLDICAMAGAYLGAAAARIPAVIDGFIGAVAAVCAMHIAPAVVPYLFASHHSDEPGMALALELLGLAAPLRLHMRLGEGSGCPLMFSVLDAACAVYANMATFEEAQIDASYLEEVRK